MGFISDDKLVVDAVVTKVGRTMLAENNFFPVKFALADDEVDYNLWDETHPQGPDFYGAIIDNMRILEANPNGEPIEMQYKLYTDAGNFRSFKVLIAAEYNSVNVQVHDFDLGKIIS